MWTLTGSCRHPGQRVPWAGQRGARIPAIHGLSSQAWRAPNSLPSATCWEKELEPGMHLKMMGKVRQALPTGRVCLRSRSPGPLRMREPVPAQAQVPTEVWTPREDTAVARWPARLFSGCLDTRSQGMPPWAVHREPHLHAEAPSVKPHRCLGPCGPISSRPAFLAALLRLQEGPLGRSLPVPCLCFLICKWEITEFPQGAAKTD